MGFDLGKSLIIAVGVVWSVFWKCYSTWTAAKHNHKKWFVALIIFNTFGILDMIYIFGVVKKKWSDVSNTVSRIFNK